MKLTRMTQILDRAFHLTSTTETSIVPYFEGPPGVGKTHKIFQWAKSRDCQVIHFDLPNMGPTDMRAFMPSGEKLVPFYNEDLHDLAANPDAKAIIFADEVTKTNSEVLKPFIKFCNERRMGRLVLPRRVMFVCAGNGVIHRSGDSRLPAAFATRMEQYQFDVDSEEVSAHFAEKGLNPKVSAYLMGSPDSVNRFDPQQLAWPNPRAWERLALKMDYAEEQGGQLAQDEMRADIGHAEAAQFWSWCDTIERLPSFRDVIADPEGTRVPEKMSDQFAMVSMMAYHTDAKSFGAVREYMSRMELNRQVLFLRLVRRKHGEKLQAVREYGQWITRSDIHKALTDS